MENLENIVSKSEKIKNFLFSIYPIFCLSAISSLINFGFSHESLNSFNPSTSISAGSSFYLGFSKNEYGKITSLGILASTYIPNITQYLSEGLSENFEQQIGIKIVNTVVAYSLGFVLKK
jgi:hypothetical protein